MEWKNTRFSHLRKENIERDKSRFLTDELQYILSLDLLILWEWVDWGFQMSWLRISTNLRMGWLRYGWVIKCDRMGRNVIWNSISSPGTVEMESKKVNLKNREWELIQWENGRPLALSNLFFFCVILQREYWGIAKRTKIKGKDSSQMPQFVFRWQYLTQTINSYGWGLIKVRSGWHFKPNQ